MNKIDNVKIVLLGYVATGKTSIISRYMYNKFDPSQVSSYNATCASKTLTYKDKIARLQIWDTCGQEKYKSITNYFYKDANAAILVYDITSQRSFDELKYWATQLNEHIDMTSVLLILAANKSDLVKEEKVSMTTAISYAKSINAYFCSISAKNNAGIVEMFDYIVNNFKPAVIRESQLIEKSTKKAKGSCC